MYNFYKTYIVSVWNHSNTFIRHGFEWFNIYILLFIIYYFILYIYIYEFYFANESTALLMKISHNRYEIIMIRYNILFIIYLHQISQLIWNIRINFIKYIFEKMFRWRNKITNYVLENIRKNCEFAKKKFIKYVCERTFHSKNRNELFRNIKKNYTWQSKKNN